MTAGDSRAILETFSQKLTRCIEARQFRRQSPTPWVFIYSSAHTYVYLWLLHPLCAAAMSSARGHGHLRFWRVQAVDAVDALQCITVYTIQRTEHRSACRTLHTLTRGSGSDQGRILRERDVEGGGKGAARKFWLGVGFIGTQTHLPPKFSFSSGIGHFILKRYL